MKRFRKVYIEITNICNKKCSFCPETKRAKAFMSVQDFEHIASQVKEVTDYVYLHVKGEPLIHPKIDEILDICNKYNLKINISTNATKLEEKLKVLQKANIRQLNISLHSFEDLEKEEQKKYILKILNSCDTLSKENIIIRYKVWNVKENTKQSKGILENLSKYYNIQLPEEAGKKDIKLRDNIYLSIKEPFVWPDNNGKYQKEGKCYGLRHQMAILVDGTVVPCCVDNDGDIPLGNIFEQDLEEIINSKKAQDIKQGFENNKCIEELCKKCEYRNQI